MQSSCWLAGELREAHYDDNNIARRYFLIALAGPFIFMCTQQRRGERAKVSEPSLRRDKNTHTATTKPQEEIKKPNRTHAARDKK